MWRSATTKWPDSTLDGKLLLSRPHPNPPLLVRDEYVKLFEKIFFVGLSTPNSGVLVTGQPGIGKTSFQYYILARLLQQKQIIVASLDGESVLLFYFNKVYYASSSFPGLLQYPVRSTSTETFLWSLVDTDKGKNEPAPGLQRNKFLVQSASPNPERYKQWVKEKNALIYGMKLWTREELEFVLQFDTNYHRLVSQLRKAYSQPTVSINEHEDISLPSQLPPLANSRFSCGDNEEFTPETAISALMDESIYRFGYVARDVIGGIFRLESQIERHREAVIEQNWESLHAIINSIRKNHVDSPSSHLIIVQQPRPVPPSDMLNRVKWMVQFKSDWIAQEFLERLASAQEWEIRKQYIVFNDVPEAESMAGRLLEPLFHKILREGGPEPWKLIMMASNGHDPPTFSTNRAAPLPTGVQFSGRVRSLHKFDPQALPATFMDGCYYLPEHLKFPLIDSFTVKINENEQSAELWAIHVTGSGEYRGSTLGYLPIRKIIANLKEQLRDLPHASKRRCPDFQPRVVVRYLLVVPQGKNLGWEWRFPEGWSRNLRINNHQGEVYCLELPVGNMNVSEYIF
ncbi:hypothetical protein C8Q75DRAFT_763582 [Abortiporus biennis]|nr:hypothetical protein C8Q75DRAFT_763582 [Abortiporus biennis]